MSDALSADTNLSSYQKTGRSPLEADNDQENDNLIPSSGQAEAPHRRKNRRHVYARHFSFEDFFSDDGKYGAHGSRFGWHRFKKRAVVFVVCLVALAVLLSATARHEQESSGGRFNGDHEVDHDFIENICTNTDPIMALKDSSTVENVQGAVASDMEICSNIGAAILRDDGGNAVDAAVATAFCLGVVNPASSGIGGGAMILVHSDFNSHKTKIEHEKYVPPNFKDARDTRQVWGSRHEQPDGGEHGRRRGASSTSTNKVTEFIDCREEAPTNATMNMFKPAETSSTDGGLAIAVPGEARGLELAHSRHGRLPWSKVVEPAMKLARDGFPVSRYLAHEVKINDKKIMAFDELRRIMTKNQDGKTLLVEGDIVKLPRLAETLRVIMERGVNAIYKGELAKQIAEDIQDAGGIVTAHDLASYEPVLRSPLVARNVQGFNIVGVGPPSSGGAAIIGAARFLAGYPDPYAYLADSLSKHRLVEASKHVFAIRMSLSDPTFNTNVTLSAVSDMVQGPYMEKLRRLTSDDGELPMSHYGGAKWAKLSDEHGEVVEGEVTDANEGDRMRRRTNDAPIDDELFDQHHRHVRRFGYLHDHGTTHLSVIDRDRNAVSITSTVNTYFGSKVVSPSTGIVFNNQMDDFSTPGKPNYFGLHPSEANYISPRKRPLSSMSPTMIFHPHDTYDDGIGDISMVLGASGGPKIISAVLQIFMNYALLGMDLYQSVASPRVHNQLLYHGKAVTTWEKEPILQGPTIRTTNETITALKNRGHSLLPVNYMGTVQAVAVDRETDTLTAVSDIRKGGKPVGC